jgi:hypothetical protein
MEDPHLDASIERLEDRVDQLRALRESTYDVVALQVQPSSWG